MWVFTETRKEAYSKKKDSNKINQLIIFQLKKILILTLIYINHNYIIFLY